MSAIETLVTDHLDLWSSAIKRRSTAGRGSSKKVELYGIKKLRELILELAVRGLLVPQDPNDEPASELLKRIAAEKARLVEEGKIRKEKPLPEISSAAYPFPLPVGWAMCHLADIAFSQAGFAFKSNFFNEIGDGLPLIRIRDVGQPFSGTYFSGEYREEFLVRRGDVLISMDGNFRVAPWAGNDALLNQRVSRLIFFSEEIPQRFIAESLQLRLLGLQGIKAYTTVDHLSGGQILESIIGIPPLAEQHRIVAKVDELMALCDQLESETEANLSAHQTLVETLLHALTRVSDAAEFKSAWKRLAEHFDSLLTTEESIDQLKQTILQLAVMGKLVPQDPNDEPASELLRKIAAEKTRLVKVGTIKSDKPLTAFTKGDTPFELPMGWAWSRFDGLIDPEYQISYGVLVPGPDVEDGVPFVRIEDLSLKNPGEQPNKKISADIDQQYARTRLVGGEILMGVVGSIGKIGVAPESWRGANIARAVCRIVPTKLLHREYIIQILQSNFMQKSFVGDTRTLAQPTLNIGFIRDTLTPIPPVAEQHRIVAKVDELMAICDQIKLRLSEFQMTHIYLADTIFEKTLVGSKQ